MKTRPRSAKFVSLPLGTNDPLGFFESIHLAGLTGEWMRLQKAVQLRFFGVAPFGKKAFKVHDNGTIEIFKTDSFGGDYDIRKVYWAQDSRQWLNVHDNSPAGNKPGTF